MMKRFAALLLCVVMLASCFVGCSSLDDEDKGQYFNVYLSNDIYDLDPANAYNNESLANVVGLMFDTLFKLDDDGKVQKSLVDDYWVEEDDNAREYTLWMRLKETCWSDGTAVSADDVVTAWKRLLAVDASYPAAALLFDIKNAKLAKEGECSIDDVGVVASEIDLVEVRFEQKIDYDHFLLNLTSVALAPLRNDIISKSDDWAKKPGTMVCSGPFRLSRVNVTHALSGETYMDTNWSEVATTADGKVYGKPGEEAKSFAAAWITDFSLERNNYYYRDNEEDDLDETVKPYRINVDCSLTPEQVLEQYNEGVILYIGDVPLSLRTNETIASKVKVASTSMSTGSVLLNENALIKRTESGGEESTEVALFKDTKVRQALSLAVDRAALAAIAVYADAATGLIPTGVWETGASESGDLSGCSGCGISYSTKTFRKANDAAYEYLSNDLAKAKSLLSESGIVPSEYSFSLTVNRYDDVQRALAEELVKFWGAEGLGFNVTLSVRGTIRNNDFYKYTEIVPADMCDDLYAEALRSGDYEAIMVDYTAYSVDPVSMLAPFAKGYTGMATDMSTDENGVAPETYEIPTHITGYDNEEYDALMKTIMEETKISARADDLREAEAILMEDMPIIPLVFHKSASVTSNKLEKLKNDNYYVQTSFTKAKMDEDDYIKYLNNGMNYLTEEKFAELAFKDGVDSEGKELTYSQFENFKKANTIYAHFYQVLAKDEETGSN